MRRRDKNEVIKVILYTSLIISIVIVSNYFSTDNNLEYVQPDLVTYPREMTIGQAIYSANCEHRSDMSPPMTFIYPGTGLPLEFSNECYLNTLLKGSCSEEGQFILEFEECPYGCEYGRCIEKVEGEYSFFFYGHRGCMQRGGECNYPENTIPALEYAIESGAPGIGIDVIMSKDGELIVGHDNNILIPKIKGCYKTTGLSLYPTNDPDTIPAPCYIDGVLENFPLEPDTYMISKLTKDQIQDNFECEVNGNVAKIPTLGEVIDYLENKFPDRNVLYGIEGKYKGEFTNYELGRKIAEVVASKGITDRSVVASYSVDVLVAAKETNSEIKLGIIGDDSWGKLADSKIAKYTPDITRETSWEKIKKSIKKLKSKGYEPDILIPQWTGGKDKWAKRVRWANNEGYKILPWVYTNSDTGINYKLFKEIGMIGFTTDRPAYASRFELTEFCNEKIIKNYHLEQTPNQFWGEFRNRRNNLCLDVKGYSGKTKDDIMLYRCETKTDQYWVHNANGQIRNGKNGLCLEVMQSNDVEIRECGGGFSEQLWFRNENNQLVNRGSNKCLTPLSINDPIKIKSDKCLNREGTYYSSIYVDDCYENNPAQQWDLVSNQRVVNIISRRLG